MIGVIGDQHFKDYLSYADRIGDQREAERKGVLDFVVDSFKDCQHIVFLGDNFHARNNSSETNRIFVEFLERFGRREIYIINGNHEKKGDGKTAIDFLGEIDKKNWHIFTKIGSIKIDKLKVDFLPYMLNSELEVEDNEKAVKKIVKSLDGGDILFVHHSITGSIFNGIKTESMNEIVLPKKELSKKYKLIVAGHIHEYQQYDNVLITGNLFTTEVGDVEKFIFKIRDDLSIENIKVPAREIHKLENPTIGNLEMIPKNSIIKVIISDKNINIEEMKKTLERFDSAFVIEDYPNERKKAHIEDGAFDFSLDALLKLYAKEKDVDYQKLLRGLNLINS